MNEKKAGTLIIRSATDLAVADWEVNLLDGTVAASDPYLPRGICMHNKSHNLQHLILGPK